MTGSSGEAGRSGENGNWTQDVLKKKGKRKRKKENEKNMYHLDFNPES